MEIYKTHIFDDNDDDNEDILFSQRNSLSNKSINQQQQVSSNSYTSLISLLEKCDNGNNNTNSENGENVEDCEKKNKVNLLLPADHQGDIIDNMETKLFRKYSKKYKNKYLKQNNKKKTSRLFSTQQQKAISGSTYNYYIKASGGYWLFTLMVTLFALQTMTTTFSSWWLSYWLNQGDGFKVRYFSCLILNFFSLFLISEQFC